jgi:hypothetical protein
MGVAPEAIVKKSYFEYRLNDIVPTFISSDRSFTLIISSGARSALPMVVAPEAIVEYFWV